MSQEDPIERDERSNHAPNPGWDSEFEDSLSSVRRASRDSRIIVFALLTFSLYMIVVHINSLL
jgi:hypothetical protein